MTITLYCADCCQNAKNKLYPHKLTAENEADFKRLVSRDHTFIEFKGNERSVLNFIGTSFAVLDCDNDHSENPAEWITLKRLAEHFPDVAFAAYTSRSHNKQKKELAPRPRFHVVFPCGRITDPEAYKALVKRIGSAFPYFDENAMDAGRFFFGNTESAVYFHEGNISITQYLDMREQLNVQAQMKLTELKKPIPEGERNSTMFSLAGKLLKRFGESDAYPIWITESARCVPLLKQNELDVIWKSACGYYAKQKLSPDYIPPEKYNKGKAIRWETPIPFEQKKLPSFPINALPEPIRNYAAALAESTQTPVDMAACAALAILALCVQGKYRINIKPGWSEPLNLYMLVVMLPSERKSAVLNAMMKPVIDYENEYNRTHAAEVEQGRMAKSILERRRRAIEEKAAKGKASPEEIEQIAAELAELQEKKPLRLFADDITTEKLCSMLSENEGKAAVISSEGGVFDMLSGIYTKTVNIDVYLKGYSGDALRVDRMGRASETVHNPALTLMMMIQPKVLENIVDNSLFRGRGLNARFLYCLPESKVGRRRYDSAPVPDSVYGAYEKAVHALLARVPAYGEITLSQEAGELVREFYNEVESKLRNEYSDMSDWAGKILGSTCRIAGIICCVNRFGEKRLVVSKEEMAGAVEIGSCFIEHAKAALTLMGADEKTEHCKRVLELIAAEKWTEFSRRDLLRKYRRIKSADELKPILDELCERGYIAEYVGAANDGSYQVPRYTANPCLFE